MTDRPRRPTVTYDRDRDERGRPANARPRDRFGRPLPRGASDELPDRRDPEETVDSAEKALEVAAGLFDAERFFEAHEFLEFIWKHPDTDPADKDFWKGVTQVAVGCCHVQRGNADGACTLLTRAADYLSAYPDTYQGIDRAALSQAALSLAAQVRSHGPSPEREFPAFPLARRQP